LSGAEARLVPFPAGLAPGLARALEARGNDGELANAITSAATHIPKTYLVKVNGPLTPEQEQQFREGVPLSGRRTAPAGLKLTYRAQNPWYEVRLTEGRKNQIREMFKHFGRLVEKLKRVKIGFLELGPLKPGEFRYLTAEEVERFRKAAAKRVAR
jgi:pseudouridine synthase